MAAQRIGSILTNVTGSANQILRVRADEAGFEFVTPPALPSYTITNDQLNRIIDANDLTIDQIGDIISTLTKDLANIYNGGPQQAFQWSTSEQVYPFEKAIDGSTLYAKYWDITLPTNAYYAVTHGITNPKPYKYWGIMNPELTTYYSTAIPEPGVNDTTHIGSYIDSTSIGVWHATYYAGRPARIFLIYGKG